MTKAKRAVDKTEIGDEQKELEQRLKRTLADYQNLERRVTEEKQMLGTMYTQIVIEKFLPVLDNLENAQKHLKDEGIEMVLKQFKDVLNREGVEELGTEGETFDPQNHEAIETVEGEKEGTVAKVIAKGYKIENRVVRPAKVIVTKTKEAELENAQSQNQEVTEISN